MKLRGPLHAAQVTELWRDRQQWWQCAQLDLQEVATLDSAGLALLVKWAKAGLARGVTPTLVGASSEFHTLANLYGVVSLFQLTELTTESK